MEQLILMLEEIRIIAKTIHYNCKGEDFYSIHKMMDKIQKPMDSFQDDIKEKFFMSNEKNPPAFKTIYEELLKDLKFDYNMLELKDAVKTTLYQIESIKGNPFLNEGQEDVLSAISSHLNLCMALLFGTLGGKNS